ncbi:hypothetical protein BDN70DRAFT_934607 [Pholiota conissans]|uniref:NADH dehydrogenase [ubiquinone] iron-sulfur protein 5 n=1 Tax=Pholiota conissans TaxID=109636 RepID=A0A9P6CS61_9AGAR|nr:hypothetical protein BDN70DRAFT_934607 [Pholiota conissans]
MASGFGWGGGRSRCFSYWQEFQKCYAQTDSPSECTPQSQDYLECLHHTKQNARNHAVLSEYERQVEHLKEQAQHKAASHPQVTAPVKQEETPTK